MTLKKVRIKEKLENLKSEMDKLAAIEKRVLASPDQQLSLTDPDSRSMATSGRGSGVVGYNVQTAVDTEHHLIVAHEVTNVGNDTAHLANTAQAAKTALLVDKLEAVADRGYFNGEEILACEQTGITVTLPKPQRSGAKSEGRFGKQDFVYLANENAYRCPAGEKLKYRFTAEEHGQKLHRYWTDACQTCPWRHANRDRCTVRCGKDESGPDVASDQGRRFKRPRCQSSEVDSGGSDANVRQWAFLRFPDGTAPRKAA